MAIINGKIKCSKCKLNLALSSFQKSVVEKACGTCRSCKQLEKNERFALNPEKVRSQNRVHASKRRKEKPEALKKINKTFQNKNPEKMRCYNLRKYGIKIDGYEVLFYEQNGKCAICKTEKNEDGRRLYVDHCHETGKIRGLLCRKCNTGIGLFGDKVESLENALKYLKKG